jgi:hypothetical protein
MATNDVWMLTVKGTVAETTHIHTLHFLEVAGPLLGQDLLDSYTGAPLTAYRSCFAIYHAPVEQITAQKVCGSLPLPSPDLYAPAPAAQVGTRGTGASEGEPAFLAALVTEKGMSAGRRYSGRFFLGGLYESDVQGNYITDAYKAVVQGYLNALAAAYIPPGGGLAWRLFCYSELLGEGDPNHTKRNPAGGARLADPVAAVPCQQAGSPTRALILSGRPTTMRSRKVGHGS